jgi:hypothetical protein
MAVSLENVTFDCADAAALAGFWAEVTGQPVDADGNEFFATVGKDSDGPTLMFVQVPEERVGKNRLHLDLASREWSAEVDRITGLGAKRFGEFDEYGAHWITLADPEGNLFDLAELR